MRFDEDGDEIEDGEISESAEINEDDPYSGIVLEGTSYSQKSENTSTLYLLFELQIYWVP